MQDIWRTHLAQRRASTLRGDVSAMTGADCSKRKKHEPKKKRAARCCSRRLEEMERKQQRTQQEASCPWQMTMLRRANLDRPEAPLRRRRRRRRPPVGGSPLAASEGCSGRPPSMRRTLSASNRLQPSPRLALAAACSRPVRPSRRLFCVGVRHSHARREQPQNRSWRRTRAGTTADPPPGWRGTAARTSRSPSRSRAVRSGFPGPSPLRLPLPATRMPPQCRLSPAVTPVSPRLAAGRSSGESEKRPALPPAGSAAARPPPPPARPRWQPHAGLCRARSRRRSRSLRPGVLAAPPRLARPPRHHAPSTTRPTSRPAPPTPRNPCRLLLLPPHANVHAALSTPIPAPPAEQGLPDRWGGRGGRGGGARSWRPRRRRRGAIGCRQPDGRSRTGLARTSAAADGRAVAGEGTYVDSAAAAAAAAAVARSRACETMTDVRAMDLGRWALSRPRGRAGMHACPGCSAPLCFLPAPRSRTAPPARPPAWLPAAWGMPRPRCPPQPMPAPPSIRPRAWLRSLRTHNPPFASPPPPQAGRLDCRSRRDPLSARLTDSTDPSTPQRPADPLIRLPSSSWLAGTGTAD